MLHKTPDVPGSNEIYFNLLIRRVFLSLHAFSGIGVRLKNVSSWRVHSDTISTGLDLQRPTYQIDRTQTI